MIRPGDDLAALIIRALESAGPVPADGDVVAVAQKAVSKAENRFVDLATVTPSSRARELAKETDKDPRMVEVILGESRRIVRHRPGLIVVEHRAGYVMANGGVDHSNVAEPDGREQVLLLPADCDASAEALRARLAAHFRCRLAVVINDSFGRAWRRGTVGVALGAAGLPSLVDMRGMPDLFGRSLMVTEVGFADEIAAAASLLMGQAAEGRPVVLLRGLTWSAPAVPARALLRPAEQDLFR
ncbi:MAG TPA: coenzyme F420-0:L-glutamate ligase [Stellaceae bacterium]|nr:coenzyme F420-0:L-glutamate ligase [Stellaceae bacterium]